MTKRSVDGYRPFEHQRKLLPRPATQERLKPGEKPPSLYAPRYSEDNLKAIVKAAGKEPQAAPEIYKGQLCHLMDDEPVSDEPERESAVLPGREALAERLERAAETYFNQRDERTEPTPQDLEEWSEEVGRACDNLLFRLRAAGVDRCEIECSARKLLKTLGFSEPGRTKEMLRRVEQRPFAQTSSLEIAAEREASERGEKYPNAWGCQDAREAIEAVGDLWQQTNLGSVGYPVQVRFEKAVLDLRRWAASVTKLALVIVGEKPLGHERDTALDTLIELLILRIWIPLFRGHFGTSTREGRASGPLVRFLTACLEPLPVEEKSKTPGAIRARVRRAHERIRAEGEEYPSPSPEPS